MITNTDRDKPLSRLLVVDDDPDNAQVLSLVNYGFLVDAFTNAKEALQKFKSNPQGYHLVLSDSLMPELSGIQLARNVKEHNLNVKVLLLTGSEMADNGFSKVFPSTCVDGFLQKPISIRKLTDKILSLLDKIKDSSSD